MAEGSFEAIKVANMLTAFRHHGIASGALVRPEATTPAHGGQRVVEAEMIRDLGLILWIDTRRWAHAAWRRSWRAELMPRESSGRSELEGLGL